MVKQLFPPASDWEVVENTPIDGRNASVSLADDGIAVELDEWGFYYDRPDEGWKAAQLKDTIDFSDIGAIRGTFDIDINWNLGDILVQVVDPGGEVAASGQGRPDDRYRDSATGETFEVNTARVTGEHYVRFRPRLERPDATLTVTLREMLADDTYYDAEPGVVLDNTGHVDAGREYAQYGARLTGIENVGSGRFKATFVPRQAEINSAGLRTGFDVVAAVNGSYAGETSFGTRASREEIEQSVTFDAEPGDWVQLVLVDETQQGIEFSISDKIGEPDISITRINITPEEVSPGEEATAEAILQNDGDMAGEAGVGFLFNGTDLGTDTVSVSPGDQERVSWTTTAGDPGEHEICFELR